VQNVESALAPAGVHGVELRERSEALLAEVGLADPGRTSRRSSPAASSSASRSLGARLRAAVILADEPDRQPRLGTGDDVIDLLAGLAATHGATVSSPPTTPTSPPGRRSASRCATARSLSRSQPALSSF
jgi:predicted ABC-type transport system involved in lysophospholipase L1 biosynthesis ATPase subunit